MINTFLLLSSSGPAFIIENPVLRYIDFLPWFPSLKTTYYCDWNNPENNYISIQHPLWIINFIDKFPVSSMFEVVDSISLTSYNASYHYAIYNCSLPELFNEEYREYIYGIIEDLKPIAMIIGAYKNILDIVDIAEKKDIILFNLYVNEYNICSSNVFNIAPYLTHIFYPALFYSFDAGIKNFFYISEKDNIEDDNKYSFLVKTLDRFGGYNSHWATIKNNDVNEMVNEIKNTYSSDCTILFYINDDMLIEYSKIKNYLSSIKNIMFMILNVDNTDLYYSFKIFYFIGEFLKESDNTYITQILRLIYNIPNDYKKYFPLMLSLYIIIYIDIILTHY